MTNMTKLAQKRKERGLSQSQLAEKSGVAVRNIRSYEQSPQGINKANALNAYKLSKALRCSLEKLLEEE